MKSDKTTVNICYAVDDNYAEYLKVSLYSMLKNRDRNFRYNIVVICAGLSVANRKSILKLIEIEQDVEIGITDVSSREAEVEYDVGSYLSVATIYRLLLFSDIFREYDKIIYLDCDTIVEGDISRLYFAKMNGKPLAAVEETGFRQMSYLKKAVYLNNSYPFNVDNYRTDALCMSHPESYFNAGVLLIDLAASRENFSFEEVLELLHCGKFFYNDQDILNILFDGQVELLDYEWNYQNSSELLVKLKPQVYGEMYADVIRNNPKIIHYVSSHKPWNEDVVLGEHYHRYESLGMKGKDNEEA